MYDTIVYEHGDFCRPEKGRPYTVLLARRTSDGTTVEARRSSSLYFKREMFNPETIPFAGINGHGASRGA